MSTRAVGIVVHQDKLLVIKRNNHGRRYYSFPGGKVELKESCRQALLRELQEETQIKVKLNKEVYHVKYDNGDEARFILANYLSGKPALSSDSEEMADHIKGENTYRPMWLPVAKLSKIKIYPLEIRELLNRDLNSGFKTEIESLYLSAK